MDANYEIPRSKSEEKFVKSFEEEEKYNLTVLNPNPVPTDGIFFYKPVNGVVSSHYEADARHFGVDLVAAPKESVLATLDGTVVFTGFDPNFGNVIQLQHKNGFLSIYKHIAERDWRPRRCRRSDRFGGKHGETVYRSASPFRVVV